MTSPLLERFNKIIDDNLSKQTLDIEEVCRELGTSRSQLFRHVKEHSQLSTSLYIRKRKLGKAKELLQASNLKLSEIAYQVGIDSPQNFSKYFSQEFGVSPSVFRKNPVSEVVDVPKKIFNRQYTYAAIAAVIVLAFSLSGYLFFKPSSPNSIAIMPFKNLGSPESAYYSEGIAQQIQGKLSLNEQLKVISTTSSGRYKDSPKLLADIAKELKVHYILEGSVFQAGNKIRINTALVRVNDDRTVWTKSFDGDTEDVFTYLADVSQEVASELGQRLNKETQQRVSKSITSSPAAYKEFLRANHLLLSRQKERLEESVQRLKNAIEFDPDFSAAYASLGSAYYLLGESAFIDDTFAHRMAEQNSLAAIRLDGTNSLAYANLGNIYKSQYKWEQAKTAFEIALKYNHNDAVVNYWYSLLLRTAGDIHEAIRYSAKARELDPLHPVIYSGHILNCVYGGELELARKEIDDGKVIFADTYHYYSSAARYYFTADQLDLAIKNIVKADQMNPKIRILKSEMAFYFAKSNQPERAKAYLDTIPDTPAYYGHRSIAYAGLGDREQSMAFLQKSADEGILGNDLRYVFYYEGYRNDSTFLKVLEKFNLLETID